MAEAARLLEAAGAQAGLTDFGDVSFREGLEQYLAALDRDAELTPLGEAALEALLTRSLVNRLRVVEWRATHPELRSERIERPLVVLGLPRTGTTLLSELLHRDSANRSLMRWEAQDCVPPPDAATFTTDVRIEAERVAVGGMDLLNPQLSAMHYEAPDGPTECVSVLAQDFKSLLWEVIAHVPSYGRWLDDCDQGSAYEYHHDVLQLLQSRAPGRWALKTPHHAYAIDAMARRYPDARLVMTHRDPVTVVASLCSLVRTFSATFSDADHAESLNEHWTTKALTIVDRVMAWRDEHGDDRFVDIAYADLVDDPVATVGAIYAHFGEDLSGPAESAMAHYVDGHPRGEHGSHRYSAEALGLDPAALADRFAPYAERFAIQPEGVRS